MRRKKKPQAEPSRSEMPVSPWRDLASPSASPPPWASPQPRCSDDEAYGQLTVSGFVALELIKRPPKVVDVWAFMQSSRRGRTNGWSRNRAYSTNSPEKKNPRTSPNSRLTVCLAVPRPLLVALCQPRLAHRPSFGDSRVYGSLKCMHFTDLLPSVSCHAAFPCRAGVFMVLPTSDVVIIASPQFRAVPGSVASSVASFLGALPRHMPLRPKPRPFRGPPGRLCYLRCPSDSGTPSLESRAMFASLT